MLIGVPKETATHERRVALTPDAVAQLAKDGLEVLVQAGAGDGAFHSDAAYEKAGAKIAPDAATLSTASPTSSPRSRSPRSKKPPNSRKAQS
jgi:alanine dehydrogenase